MIPMLHRKIVLVITLFFVLQCSFGQNGNLHIKSNPNHPLYKLEKKLISGDKNAFYEIGSYFDSEIELEEKFAYNHIWSYVEGHVARRMIMVNSVFTEEEVALDTISAEDFKQFLNENLERITYSDLAGAYLITSLESHKVKVMFREMTEGKKRELKSEYEKVLHFINNSEIETLIKKKDPKVLLIITSELYKERDWLNSLNCYNEGSKIVQYLQLLEILTDCEIGVDNGHNRMTWHIHKDFHPEKAALNLLCYFSANYPNFKWNNRKERFENKEIQIIPINREKDLFYLLNNKNDSIALDAFTQLTTCDPQKVIELADEYEYAGFRQNWAIPQFPYRMLKQLVLLTDYCDKNDIDFMGSAQLKSSISKLKEKLSFPERRRLEDSLINNLTLEEITAFEYWVIINQASFNLMYSAGRVLDIFYSKNWTQLLKDEKHLNWYIKKSALFNRLGIVGTCNNYLVKFINSSEETIAYLEKHQTSDEDIRIQIKKIIASNTPDRSKNKEESLSSYGNYDCEVTDLEEQLIRWTKQTKQSKETDQAISKLLSQINYEQIPIAIELVEDYKFQSHWMSKYSFMDRDFGFFMIGDLEIPEVKKEFLNLYSQFSEYELYSYYLDKAGIDYKTNNELDFDKIYDLIKFNVVTSFLGGSTRDNEVYSLIKLLEIKFNTTLGFPKKLCNSNNMYGCDSRERAKAWRAYLTEHNLLKKEHNEPNSFCYYE